MSISHADRQKTINALPRRLRRLARERVSRPDAGGRARRRRCYDVLKLLKEKHGFDLLVDVTCVDYLHYRGAKDRFGLVYLLANTATNERLTVRCFRERSRADGPSVVGLWEGANGWSARCGTCSASASPAIPTCGGSCCPRSSRPFRCARIIRCKGAASGTISR